MTWLLDPYRERRTYTILGYLLAGVPVATAGFCITVVGLSLGVGLAITLAGIPVLVATLRFVHGWAAFERSFATSALGITLPRHRPRPAPSGWWWRRLAHETSDPATWRELAFIVLVRLPLAIAGLTAGLTVVGLMFGGFAHPIVYLAGVDSEIGSWQIDTFGESLVFVPISLMFLVIGPRLIVGIGRVVGAITQRALGHVERAELATEIVGIVAANGPIDAFRIHDLLEQDIGDGPWLNTVRVEAALLELEASGRLDGDHTGRVARYERSPAPTP